MYETPNALLQTAKEIRVGPDRFRMVGPDRWHQVRDEILQRFTRRRLDNRDLGWLWEDVAEPSCRLSSDRPLEVIASFADPRARVWALFEDRDRTKRDGAHWLFEAELAAVLSVVTHRDSIQFETGGAVGDRRPEPSCQLDWGRRPIGVMLTGRQRR